jgi:hypothetical protein
MGCFYYEKPSDYSPSLQAWGVVTSIGGLSGVAVLRLSAGLARKGSKR